MGTHAYCALRKTHKDTTGTQCTAASLRVCTRITHANKAGPAVCYVIDKAFNCTIIDGQENEPRRKKKDMHETTTPDDTSAASLRTWRRALNDIFFYHRTSKQAGGVGPRAAACAGLVRPDPPGHHTAQHTCTTWFLKRKKKKTCTTLSDLFGQEQEEQDGFGLLPITTMAEASKKIRQQWNWLTEHLLWCRFEKKLLWC